MKDLPNPYIRLLKLTGLTQLEFGQKHQFSPTTMTYISTGQFADLSDRMILALGNECRERGIENVSELLKDEYGGTGSLQGAYHYWQSQDRKQYGDLLRTVKWPNPRTSKYSPMRYLVRESLGSFQGFCKRLHVPSATLDRYTYGYTKTMPRAIRQALEDAGYTKIDQLAAAMDEWNERHA